jgi:hypothetical protein
MEIRDKLRQMPWEDAMHATVGVLAFFGFGYLFSVLLSFLDDQLRWCTGWCGLVWLILVIPVGWCFIAPIVVTYSACNGEYSRASKEPQRRLESWQRWRHEGELKLEQLAKEQLFHPRHAKQSAYRA